MPLISFYNPWKHQCSHHIETSQLNCRANQLTGFYMMGTLMFSRCIEREQKHEMGLNNVTLKKSIYGSPVKTHAWFIQ